MPEEIVSAPSEKKQAPTLNRFASDCSPKAKGRKQNPAKTPIAPTAIIQLPARDDIFERSFLAEVRSASLESWVNHLL
jgi:hypothetical protein